MKTISLELARELQSVCKEKNITMYKSDNAWVKYADERYIEYNEPFVIQHAVVDEDYEYLAPAFLLCELMEWLPREIMAGRWSCGMTVASHWDNKTWIAGYEYNSKFWLNDTDPNPANAACKLLIYLIKKGLI